MPNNFSSERLSADDERIIATQIKDAEERAQKTIEHIEIAKTILDQRPERVERTRAGAVDRIENAVLAIIEASREDHTLYLAAYDAEVAGKKPKIFAGVWPCPVAGSLTVRLASLPVPSWMKKTSCKKVTSVYCVPQSALTLSVAFDSQPMPAGGSVHK